MKKTFTSDVQNMDQLQKKGSWKRFFHIIVAGNVPWLLIIPAFLFETLSAKLSVWFPVYQQKITGGDFSAKTIGLAVFFLIAYRLLFSNFWSAFNQYQWQIVPKNLKLVIYNKILSLPARFFDRYKSRELLSRITTDTEGMIYMLEFPTSVYGAVLAFYLMVKQLFTYDSRLAWFLMAMVPVIAIIQIVSTNIQYKYNIKAKTAESKLVGYLADTLSNIPVVKTFVTEKKEKKKGLSFIDKLFKVNLKAYMWGALFGSLSSFTILGIDTLMTFTIQRYTEEARYVRHLTVCMAWDWTRNIINQRS
jgi:ATP-binding cassette subfamily B protein AbcA/BmrA